MKQLTEGRDYYINAQGLFTFTASYLQNRGFCCGNGCLHCPYSYENVPEPLRAELKEKQKNPQSV